MDIPHKTKTKKLGKIDCLLNDSIGVRHVHAGSFSGVIGLTWLHVVPSALVWAWDRSFLLETVCCTGWWCGRLREWCPGGSCCASHKTHLHLSCSHWLTAGCIGAQNAGPCARHHCGDWRANACGSLPWLLLVPLRHEQAWAAAVLSVLHAIVVPLAPARIPAAEHHHHCQEATESLLQHVQGFAGTC